MPAILLPMMDAASKQSVAGGIPQPPFSTVQFLAHWEGADEQTSYTEESNNAASGTFAGQAKLDNGVSMFGTTSLQLDGNGDQVSFTDIAGYTIGSNDFTVESFIWFDSVATARYIMSQWDTVNTDRTFYFLWNSNSLQFAYEAVVGGFSCNGTFNASTSTWYHVAFSRNGNTGRLFLDGTQIQTINMTGHTLRDSVQPLRIGAQQAVAGTFNWFGRLNETRIAIGSGAGIYTENFTPPTEPHPEA